MYCAPFCSLPLSDTLRLINCEAVLEPQQRCRARDLHWQSPERLWCLRNGEKLQMLADKLERPVEHVCKFMYALTLRRFGQIMNPKCSGWNYCRVPMTRTETCALYRGMFLDDGNIREPLHRLIIRILLMVMDHFLSLPCQGNKESGPKKKDDLFTGSGDKCLDLFKKKGRRGQRGAQGGRFGDGFGDDFADAFNEFCDETGLGKEYGDTNQDESKEEINEDEDMGDESPELNDLYGKLKKKKAEEEEEPAPPRPKKPKKVKPPKKKKHKGTKSHYMGRLIPVLMHEPFDDRKPWTWVRRHPVQERVLEGKHIGKAKVHHYKRETLEAQMKHAKQRLSVHSVYSVRDHESVISTGMFGHGTATKKNAAMAKHLDYKKLTEKVPETVHTKKKP